MKIDVTVSKSPMPKITGAALRSAIAAEAQWDAAIVSLQSATQELENLLNIPADQIDATWVAVAMTACDHWAKRRQDIPSSPKRCTCQVSGTNKWPCYRSDDWNTPWEAIHKAGARLAQSLLDAGVPLPESMTTIEDWRDAAARGC